MCGLVVDGPPAVVAVLETLAWVVSPAGVVASLQGGWGGDEGVDSEPEGSADVVEVCELLQ